MKIKNRNNTINKSKGSALIIVIIILMVSMVIITTLMSVTMTSSKISLADKEFETVYYAAEGVLTYELDMIENDINMIYDSVDNETDFNIQVENYFNSYGKTYADTAFTVKNTNVTVSALQDTTDTSKYSITAEGSKRVNNSVAPRIAKLVSEVAVQWVDKSASLADAPMWVGNGETASLVLNTDAKIGTDSNPVNTFFRINTYGSSGYPLSMWSEETEFHAKINTNANCLKEQIVSPWAKGAVDVSIAKINTFPELNSVTFPNNKNEFFDTIKNNTDGTAYRSFNANGSGDYIITETAFKNGQPKITLDGYDEVSITFRNGGQFEFNNVALCQHSKLVIYSDTDIELYFNKLEASNYAQLVFQGTGEKYIYTNNNFKTSNDTRVGQQSNPEDVTVFSKNSCSVTNDSKLFGSLIVKKDFSLNSNAQIVGTLFAASRARIHIDNNETPDNGSCVLGGIFAPDSLVVMTNKAKLNEFIVCDKLEMNNNSFIENMNIDINKLLENIRDLDENTIPKTGSSNDKVFDPSKIKRTY